MTQISRVKKSSDRASKRIHLALISLLILALSASSTPVTLASASPLAIDSSSLARQNTQATLLEAGKALDREIAGGATHTYQINLEAGQFFRALVEQKTGNLVVALFSPEGKKLVEADYNFDEIEKVSIIAEVSGNYRLEITSTEKSATAKKYSVTIEGIRTATERDAKVVAAERAFLEAWFLSNQNTKESLSLAIKKYEAALQIYREMGDRFEEATVLNNLKRVQIKVL